MPASLQGKAQTVLGAIGPESLGVVLPHDHLFGDVSGQMGSAAPAPPASASDRAYFYQPITMENLWWVRYHWNNLDNWRLVDMDTAVREATMFKVEGGNTIVDLTVTGLGRDPLGLARVSRTTGLNIVMGTGYYREGTHPPGMDGRSEEDIAEEMVRDVTEGVEGTGVRAGIIGELGNSWPWLPNERKVVRAGARAQRITGAPVSIHPGRDPRSPFAILETLAEAGADLTRVVMGHVDRTLFDPAEHRRLAETGCYVEFDLFGFDSSYYPYSPPIDMPSDAQRIDHIMRLIEAGHLERLLVSHDVCKNIQLTKYGGNGYGHILRNIVPIMRRKGMTEEQVHTILVENPARMLTFTASAP